MEKEEYRMEQNLGHDYVYLRINRKWRKSSRQTTIILYTFLCIFKTIKKNLFEGQTFRREDDGCIMIDFRVKTSKYHSKEGLIAIYREFPVQRLIFLALALKKRIFDDFSIYRLNFSLFHCHLFLFRYDIGRRCFVPCPFCLFLLSLSLKGRIFLD